MKERKEARHNIVFLFFVAATIGLFLKPIGSVLALLHHEGPIGHYSHIVMIPFVYGYLLYLQRETIISAAEWQLWLGLPVVGLGMVLYVFTPTPQSESLDFLSLHMLSMVVVCWGAFLCCYGVRAFQAASFGLLILLAMVPLPSFILDPVIRFLQSGSAEGVNFLFHLLGIPVHRQGVVFSLSNLAIEIAPECSGIRSSLALAISSLVAGHLLLRSTWGKTILVLLVVPLVVIKNAARITILSLLGNYVDPAFLTDSALHSRGGIPIFLLSLVVLLGMIWLLRRWEASCIRLPFLTAQT